MRVVGIVGHQGSGKTTLIERLIPALRARSLSVSTIKHTHHHQIELDAPGKDSYRHRTAGASEVIVASDTGWARIAACAEPATAIAKPTAATKLPKVRAFISLSPG